MSGARVQIRGAEAADHAQWEPLWQAYLEFYQARLDDAVSIELWRRILDQTHEFDCRVAALPDGNLVGFTHFFPHPHTWYRQPVCYLNDLFVLPDIRGGGIGEALVDAVLQEAKSRGWAEVYWLTQHDNAVARGLYDKITGGSDGFVNYQVKLSD